MLSPSAVSYNMAQLSASTEYSVKLQAIAGPKRSRVITTVFTTGEWTPLCYRDGIINTAVILSTMKHRCPAPGVQQYIFFNSKNKM